MFISIFLVLISSFIELETIPPPFFFLLYSTLYLQGFYQYSLWYTAFSYPLKMVFYLPRGLQYSSSSCHSSHPLASHCGNQGASPAVVSQNWWKLCHFPAILGHWNALSPKDWIEKPKEVEITLKLKSEKKSLASLAQLLCTSIFQ